LVGALSIAVLSLTSQRTVKNPLCRLRLGEDFSADKDKEREGRVGKVVAEDGVGQEDVGAEIFNDISIC
jgi:hypothetical protein